MPEDKTKILWESLNKDGFYTKTYPEFKEQFSNEESLNALYTALSKDRLYTKDINDFKEQFFPDVKKKDETGLEKLANISQKDLPEAFQEHISSLQAESKSESQETKGEEPKPKFKEKAASYMLDLFEKIGAGTLDLATSGESQAGFLNRLLDIPKDVVKKELSLIGIPEDKAEKIAGFIPFLKPRQIGMGADVSEKAWEKISKTEAFKDVEAKADEMREASQRYDATTTELWKRGDKTKAIGSAFLGAAESLPLTLMAAFGGPAGIGFIGSYTAAEKYDSLEGRTDIKEPVKLINAIATGGFEMLTEQLGTATYGKMLKDLYKTAGKEAAEEAIKRGSKTWLASMFKKFGLYTSPVGQGLEEGVNEFAQNVTNYAMGITDVWNPMENVWDAMASGAAMGTVFTAAGAPKMFFEKKAEQREKAMVEPKPPKGPITETGEIPLAEGLEEEIAAEKAKEEPTVKETVTVQKEEVSTEREQEGKMNKPEQIAKELELEYKGVAEGEKAEENMDTYNVEVGGENYTFNVPVGSTQEVVKEAMDKQVKKAEAAPSPIQESIKKAQEEGLLPKEKVKPEEVKVTEVSRKKAGKYTSKGVGAEHITSEVQYKGEKVGDIELGVKGEDLRMNKIILNKKYQGTGVIGIEAYRQANEMAKERGGVLISSETISEPAKKVWEKLISTGEAVKEGDVYKFKPKEKVVEKSFDDVVRDVVEKSESPEEVYNTYKEAEVQYGKELPPWQEELMGRKVAKSSLAEFGDPNKFGKAMMHNWIAKKDPVTGKWKNTEYLDVIAQELSETHKKEITPDMIAEFIMGNPSKTKVKAKHPNLKALEDKMKELTGGTMEAYEKAEGIAERKEAAKAKINDALARMRNKVGGVSITPEERTSWIEDISLLAEGIAEELAVKGQELIDAIKKYLKDNKINVPDDIIEEGTKKASIKIEELRKEAEIKPIEAISEPISPEAVETTKEEEKVAVPSEIKPEGKKMRSIAKRFMEAPEEKVSRELKEGIMFETDVMYIPQSNVLTAEEGDLIFDSYSTEQIETEIRNPANGMKAAVRVYLGARLVRLYEDTANEAGKADDRLKENEYRDRAIAVYEYMANDMSVDWGQGIQMWASHQIADILGPKTQRRRVEKEKQKNKEIFLKGKEPDIKSKKAVIQKINEESIEEILSDPAKLAAIIYKATKQGRVKVKYKRRQVSQEKAKAAEERISQRWDLIRAEAKNAPLTSTGINPKLMELLTAQIGDYIVWGYNRVIDIIGKLQEDFLNKTGRELTQDEIAELLKKKYNGKSLYEIEVEAVVETAEVKEKVKGQPIWTKYRKTTILSIIDKLTKMKGDHEMATTPPLQEFATRLRNTLKGRIDEFSPPDRQITKRSDVDLLGEVVKNVEKYMEVIDNVRDQIVEEYWGDEEMLTAFDNILKGLTTQPFSQKMVERATRELMKELELDMNSIIRSHYSIQDAAKKSLADKFIERLGMESEQANEVAKLIQDEFSNIATQRKIKALDGLLKRKGAVKTRNAKREWDRIIELSNMGAFSDAEFRDAIAESYGYGKLTEEDGRKIEELARKVQEAPDGFQTFNATQDLMMGILKIEGINPLDIAMDIWYANMLMGYTTQEKNIGNNIMNSFLELITSASLDPKAAWMLTRAMFEGYGTGTKEFASVLKTGYAPLKGKMEMPSVLHAAELPKFFKFLKQWDKVRRFMIGADMMSYTGNRNMRLHEMAKAAAKDKGLWGELPGRSDYRKASDYLGFTKEAKRDAEKQAREEGLTSKSDISRRVYEIMIRRLPQDFLEDSDTFAAEATYNYRPVGTLGLVTRAMSQLVRMIEVQVGTKIKEGKAVPLTIQPTRFVIPFTQIISNVANNNLNYHPLYGMIRLSKGAYGFRHMEKYGIAKGAYRPLSEVEKKKHWKKVLIGTTAAGVFAFLSGEDDEGKTMGERLFGFPVMITANGTGDWQKNKQLLETGWQPYSIRIGKRWFGYQYTPLVLALAPVGFYRDFHKYQDKYEGDWKDRFHGMMNALARGFTVIGDMTFLASLSNIIGVFSSPSIDQQLSKVGRMLRRAATTIVKPNLVTQINKQVMDWANADMLDRDGITSELLKFTPIVRNKYYNRLNTLGEYIPVDASVFLSKVEEHPYYTWLIENNAYISVPDKKSFNEYDLGEAMVRNPDREEWFNFMKIRGDYIKKGLDNIKDKGYDKERVQDEVRSLSDKATSVAKSALFGYINIKDETPYKAKWYKMVQYGIIFPKYSKSQVEIGGETYQLPDELKAKMQDKVNEIYVEILGDDGIFKLSAERVGKLMNEITDDGNSCEMRDRAKKCFDSATGFAEDEMEDIIVKEGKLLK